MFWLLSIYIGLKRKENRKILWCGEHWLQSTGPVSHSFSHATDYFSFFFPALSTKSSSPNFLSFFRSHFLKIFTYSKFSWSFFLTCNMASIIASLPPPLLAHGRRTLLTALPKLPVCSMGGELHTYQSCYSGFFFFF